MNTLKLTAIAVSGVFSAHLQAQTAPNVIIILLDDMGYGDLSVTGATGYKTSSFSMCGIQADGVSPSVATMRIYYPRL